MVYNKKNNLGGERSMSIGYTLFMKDRRLTKEILLSKLSEMGWFHTSIDVLPKGGIRLSFEKQVGAYIYLFHTERENKVYEMQFLNEMMLYSNVLDFELVKDYPNECYEDRHKNIFKIIFELMYGLREQALLVHYSSFEMCFFSEEQMVIINKECALWNEGFLKYCLRQFPNRCIMK